MAIRKPTKKKEVIEHPLVEPHDIVLLIGSAPQFYRAYLSKTHLTRRGEDAPHMADIWLRNTIRTIMDVERMLGKFYPKPNGKTKAAIKDRFVAKLFEGKCAAACEQFYADTGFKPQFGVIRKPIDFRIDPFLDQPENSLQSKLEDVPSAEIDNEVPSGLSARKLTPAASATRFDEMRKSMESNEVSSEPKLKP